MATLSSLLNGYTGPQGPQGQQGQEGEAGDKYATTSSSSNSIGTGSKTFTVDSSLAYSTAQTVIIAYDASNTMEGEVTSYSGTTLIINVTSSNGSGTYASWSINLAGAPGPAGDTGAQGPQGNIGAQGPIGNTGDTGLQGNQGLQGPQGNIGAQGPIGNTGDTGLQGNQGLQGPQGNTGTTGTQGPNGFQGNQGLQGFQGNVGTQGNQGLLGPQGNQGIAGTIGDTGVQGNQGLQGPQGNQGMTGAVGDTGAQGNQGLIGPQGSEGIAGDKYATTSSSSNSIGTGSKTFTVDSGLAYSTAQTVIIAYDVNNTMEGEVTSYSGTTLVVNVTTSNGSGTYNSWNINLAGAPGPTGDTGAQGNQGLQGPQGNIGAQGTQGLRGFQGNQGLLGTQGNVGTQGNQGLQGPQGNIGSQGSSGLNSYVFSMKYDDGSSNSDPSSQYFRFGTPTGGWSSNNSSLAIDHTDLDSNDIETLLESLKEGGIIRGQNNNTYFLFSVNSIVNFTSLGESWTFLGGTTIGLGASSPSVDDVFYFTISAQGTMGHMLSYNYDTSTTSGDPGTSNLRFDTSWASSPSWFTVDDTDADSNSVADFWNNISVGYIMRITRAGTPTIYKLLRITGRTSYSGYEYFTVTQLASSSGAPLDGDRIYISLSESGPQGTAGADGDKYATTSSTSNSIGTGSKTFTVDSELAYTTAQSVIVAYDSSNTMEGSVTSYSGTTLVLNISSANGSGTYTSWSINLAGAPGPAGDTGAQGPQGIAGSNGTNGVQGPQGNQGVAGSNGTNGVQGPQGFQGSNGAQGPQGLIGTNGDDGTIWTTGSNIPSSSGANEGDLYLQTSNGDVYEWNGSSWDLIDNLTGPQGIAGTNGTNGTQGPQGPSASDSNFAANNLTFTGARTHNLNGNTLRIDGSTGNMSLNLTSDGVLEIGTGETQGDGAALRLYENATNGTNYVELISPDSLSSTLQFKLPSAYGTSGQVLYTSDNVGTLGWTSSAAGGAGTQGPQGPQGIAGSNGTNGAQGPQGPGFSSITSPSNNRILTSDGSSNSAVAEANLSFDGNYLNIEGAIRPTPLSPSTKLIGSIDVLQSHKISEVFNGKFIQLDSVFTQEIGVLYNLTSSGYTYSNASSATYSTNFLGIGTYNGNSANIFYEGMFTILDSRMGGTASLGAPIYADDTAGVMTFDPPSGTGSVVRIIGHCVQSFNDKGTIYNTIRFNPSHEWLEL